MDLDKFQSVIDSNAKVKADLYEIGIDSATDLLARYRLDREKLQELADGVERNTDDNMRVEYSAPLNLYTWTGDENVLMLEQSVGKVPLVPFEATVGADGLIDLAKSYEELELWVQALMCLKEAEKREPGRNDVAAMYIQFQHELNEQMAAQKENSAG